MTYLRITLAAITLLATVTAAEAQCRRSSCQTGRTYRQPSPQPYYSPALTTPQLVQPLGPASGAETDRGATAGDRLRQGSNNTGLSTPTADDNVERSRRDRLREVLGIGEDESRQYTVHVQHPATERFVHYETYRSREAASRALGDLARHYWLISHHGGKNEYRIGQESELNSHLQTPGARVERIVAEIREAGIATALEEAIRSAPSDPQTPETTDRPSLPPLPAESDLSALVGVWEAVAVTGSGKPIKLTIQLDAGGTTTWIIPDGESGQKTVQARTELLDNQWMLEDGRSLGQLERVERDSVTLSGPNGRVTLIRKEALDRADPEA